MPPGAFCLGCDVQTIGLTLAVRSVGLSPRPGTRAFRNV